MRQKLLSITQSLRLPSICLLCEQYHQGSHALCTHCTALIRPLGPACERCANPLPDGDFLICGQCIKSPPHFDKTIIGYTFEEPLRELLHRFKYNTSLYLGSFIVHLMLEAFKTNPSQAQCLIPVPMHPKRLKTRGFNQAAVLAQQLARHLKLPCDLTRCIKKTNTAPQASLNAEERQKNLRHSFLAKPMPYKHVILIDDLLTTGSTANEMAYSLKKVGVRQVDVWCCARTLRE